MNASLEEDPPRENDSLYDVDNNYPTTLGQANCDLFPVGGKEATSDLFIIFHFFYVIHQASENPSGIIPSTPSSFYTGLLLPRYHSRNYTFNYLDLALGQKTSFLLECSNQTTSAGIMTSWHPRLIELSLDLLSQALTKLNTPLVE